MTVSTVESNVLGPITASLTEQVEGWRLAHQGCSQRWARRKGLSASDVADLARGLGLDEAKPEPPAARAPVCDCGHDEVVHGDDLDVRSRPMAWARTGCCLLDECDCEGYRPLATIREQA
jgi:hypothetical protein